MDRRDHISSRYLEVLPTIQGIESYELQLSRAGVPQAYDGVVRLRTKSGHLSLAAVEYKSHLTHQIAEHLASTRPPDMALLVLAPHIGSKLGAKLAAGGINYLDGNGNCHIAIDDLFIHIEGRSRPARPSLGKGIRAAGYQALFAYLAEPSLVDRPLREVGDRVDVSRQAVSDMKKRLIEMGYLVATKSAVRWVSRRRSDALAMWLHGYRSAVRPGLVWATYRTPDRHDDLERRIESTFREAGIFEHRWGGSAAGFRLTGHYRGERTVVHVRSTPGDIRRRLRAITDPHGNLVLMNAFGGINWEREDACVHPLLVYSEMLAEDSERAREAAEVLFHQHVVPVWGSVP